MDLKDLSMDQLQSFRGDMIQELAGCCARGNGNPGRIRVVIGSASSFTESLWINHGQIIGNHCPLWP